MTYNTYTNESDDAFAAQLDAYKLGPGVSPGGSEFWAAEAAMNSLGNDPMNVARLMESRARLHASSMATRKAVSSDISKAQEADEFDSFSKDMQQGIRPGDYVHNAALGEQMAIKYGGNDDAMKALGVFNAAQEQRVKARGFKKQEWQADMDDETLADQAEIIRVGIKNNLKAMEEESRSIELMKQKNDDEIFGAVMDSIGRLLSRSPEVAKEGSGVLSVLQSSGDYASAKMLGETLGKFSRGTMMESLYREETKAVSVTINDIKNSYGIDLNSAQTPEEYAALLAATKEAVDKDKTKNGAKVSAALRTHGQMMGSYLARSAMEKKLIEHLRSAPDVMVGEPAAAWKRKMAMLSSEAKLIDGIVTEQARVVKDREDTRDRALTEQKMLQDIVGKQERLKIDKERLDIDRVANALRARAQNYGQMKGWLEFVIDDAKSSSEAERRAKVIEEIMQKSGFKLPDGFGKPESSSTLW